MTAQAENERLKSEMKLIQNQLQKSKEGNDALIGSFRFTQMQNVKQ